MNIVFEVGDQRVTAILDDTPVARAFAEMLPLDLELSDFGGGVEKIADLPASLPTNDAPSGMKPVAGDITYYSPWGNLAIFRKGFSHANGLIKLGRFTSDFSPIDRSGPVSVRIQHEE